MVETFLTQLPQYMHGDLLQIKPNCCPLFNSYYTATATNQLTDDDYTINTTLQSIRGFMFLEYCPAINQAYVFPRIPR